MYRPDDDVLRAGFRGHDRTVALRAAKCLGLLSVAWLTLLIATFHPAMKTGRTAYAPATPAAKPRASPLTLPEAETAEPMALTPDDARRFNATVPFVAGPISPGRKFVYAGSREDRERALTCLASAVLYEAGDDRTGQQAVA